MTIATKPQHLLWEEKYRPNILDDVVIPPDLKASLKSYIKDGKVPSMLFYSTSPGTGKTTTAYAVCHELDIKPLFINASLNNSIDEIRMNVVQYATTASMFGASQKVVILDEADRLSAAAQDSLKGLMEAVSGNCSFVLTCNSKSRISEPLASRCSEIDFVYAQKDQIALSAQMIKRCCAILTSENVTFDLPSVVAVVRKFAPDNRKILKTLQAYASMNDRKIDTGILGRLAGADEEALTQSMKEKKFEEVKSWCMANFDRLGDDFYKRMFMLMEPKIKDQAVPQLVLILNDYQRYHATVPDKFVHFLALTIQVMMECPFKG